MSYLYVGRYVWEAYVGGISVFVGAYMRGISAAPRICDPPGLQYHLLYSQYETVYGQPPYDHRS